MTDYISAYSQSGELFVPRLFQGFPEIKEALMSNKMQAAFMVAPMAIALRAQGVPVKIVYLGHRYGSAVVVRRDGPVKQFSDLRGRVIAVPSRFSDERLILFRALRVNHMNPKDLHMVEMAPPDVAVLLRKIELLTKSDAPNIAMPPPLVAVLLITLLFVTVNVPALTMIAPP